MKIVNKIALHLEGFEQEVETALKNEVSLGRLYDYACALLAFTVQKMNEAKDIQIKKPEVPEELPTMDIVENPKAQ